MRLSLMVDMNCTPQFMKFIESRSVSYPRRSESEHVRTPELVALEATCTMDVWFVTRFRLVRYLFYRHISAIEHIIHRSIHFILHVLRWHRKMSWVTWRSEIPISSLCEFLITYPYGFLTTSWGKRLMLLLWCAIYGHEWFGLLRHYWKSSYF
jgi:hypothetical protein